ncbi:MAG: nucleotidyltransferase family protein, partial [Chloroflexota bacterium]
MQAVVLMGGEATRLRPLTWGLPKAMLPVLNIPFLAHLLNYLQKQGVSDIILALGFQSPFIEDYLAHSQLPVRVRCITETSPLGTAGAVRNLSPYVEQSFFVLNGDIFTDLDLKDMLQFHRQRRSKLTIALTPVADPSSFGVVNTDEHSRVTSFVEKPSPGT